MHYEGMMRPHSENKTIMEEVVSTVTITMTSVLKEPYTISKHIQTNLYED